MEDKIRVDSVERALELRNTLIRTQKKFFSKRKEALVVDFSDTSQGKDNYKAIGLMPNIRTGEYVFRTKINIKEIDPIAMKNRRAGDMSKDLVDLTKMSYEEIQDFVNKKSHFDFPLWFKHVPGFKMERILDYNSPFIVQVGGCNFHDGTETGGCWYCFVDDKSNDGKIAKGKTWIGAKDIVKSMMAARKEKKEQYAKEGVDMDMKVLRISGGEPTLVLDFILDVWKYVERKGINIVGQADTNCSTGSIVDRFAYEGIYKPHTLEIVAEYPIKWLTAIKGVNDENIQSNVQSTATLKEQIYSLKKFVRAGLDIYPEMYNPQPASLQHYLTLIDSQIENFALKIHIGSLQGFYGPTKQRLTLEAKRLGIEPEAFIKNKESEWDNNYNDGIAVLNDYLQKNYGVGYKEVVRPDVDLKVLKP